jgi:hypothetical protein
MLDKLAAVVAGLTQAKEEAEALIRGTQSRRKK